MRSLRTRLALTLVALVTLTVAAIGVGVYAFVDASLRDRLVADARQQADFNLSVLLPATDPAAGVDAGGVRGERPARAVPAARRRRASSPTSVTASPLEPAGPPGRPGGGLARRCATIVAGGRARLRVADGRRRAGARRRRAPGGPARRSTSCSRRGAVEDALAQLRARPARGRAASAILRRARSSPASSPAASSGRSPQAARAARRIAAGDLEARVPERRPGRDGPLGRGLQPDGRLAPGDRRAAGGARRARTGGSSRTWRTSSGRR